MVWGMMDGQKGVNQEGSNYAATEQETRSGSECIISSSSMIRMDYTGYCVLISAHTFVKACPAVLPNLSRHMNSSRCRAN